MRLADELGKRRQLMVVKKVDFGVYLGTNDDKVLLPKKQVPKDIEVGDPIEVFLYKDSSDRLIATTQEPKITLDQMAVLKVVDTGKIGAFLDWGLEKDLLLPFREQTAKLKKGDEVLVSLYVDKSGRLCATMKLYHKLKTDSPYKKDDQVEGIVYEISDNFGVFVAVDNQYSALIPKREGRRQAEGGRPGSCPCFQGKRRWEAGFKCAGKGVPSDGCRCRCDREADGGIRRKTAVYR